MAGDNTTARKPNLAMATLSSLIVVFIVFLLLIVLSQRGLGGIGGNTGNITLSDVTLKAEADDWYLDADADIELPPTVRAGLDSGVPLQFTLTINLKSPRQYWFDETVAEFERRYRLTFYELTRHYRVEALANGGRKNYRSLLSALDGLGTLRSVAIGASGVNEIALEEGKALVGNMRLQLDTHALPLSLQPLITSTWRLASEEYVWPIN